MARETRMAGRDKDRDKERERLENERLLKEWKTLYRAMYESVQKLEKMLRHTSDLSLIFGDKMSKERKKIRILGERQLFLRSPRRDKLEDVIWRKSFYDVIQACKQQRQEFATDSSLLLNLRRHLEIASGFYRHLVVRLEEDFNIDLKGVVSWSRATICRHSQSLDDGSELIWCDDDETTEWALSACHRCLIYLGDLARYQLEFEGGTTRLAVMYYKQAIYLDPSVGLPHNQLALLAGSENEGFDAVFHYLMCVAGRVPFPGAEHNLLRLWDKNSSSLKMLEQEYFGEAKETEIQTVVLKRCLIRFLDLQRKLRPPYRISQEELGVQYEKVLHDFIDCLGFKLHQMDHPFSDESKVNTSNCLSGSLMLKIVALSMLAAHKLRLQGSRFTPAATAFALSLYSQLLQHCTQSIDSWKKLFKQGLAPESTVLLPCEDDQQKYALGIADRRVVERSSSEDETTKEPRKRRRRKRAAAARRRRRVAEESDSEEEGEETGQIEKVSEDDLSEGGGDFNSDEISPELSDLSDGDGATKKQRDLNGIGGGLKTAGKRPLAIRFPGLQEQLEGDDTKNARDIQRTTGTIDKKKNPLEETVPFIRWLCSHHFLPSVKIIFDWLRIHPAIVASGSQSLSSFWSRMAELLNSLPTAASLCVAGFTANEDDSEWKQVDPLPEDVELLGFPPLTRALDMLQMNWAFEQPVSRGWMGLTRLKCLLSFGAFIAESKTVNVFYYDESSRRFIGPSQKAEQEAAATAKKSKQQEEEDKLKRVKLMKALAAQKLKSDVASMEQTLTQAVQAASPILVIDAQCLCTHIKIIKQFVDSEQFIIIIPLHVIEALDDLKKGKDSHTAREAIKFLEHEFKTGNRWIRAQQEQETYDGKADNVPPRYKRKDIAAWRFIRVVDCAHYFSEQIGRSMVTLLYSATHSVVAPLPHSEASQEGLMPNTGTRPTETALAIANRQGVAVEEIKKFHAKLKLTTKKKESIVA